MNAFTQFELQAPKHIISLASSALIVSAEVNVWTATKQDRQISNEVTQQKNASADAGRFTKNLLANCPQHKALLNHRQTVYNWLQRCTYDWAGSLRLLPTFRLESFKKEYAEHEQAFTRLLDDFIDAYPSLVSDAAFKQGDMFDRSEYPEVKDVRNKFRMRLITTTVPAGDFRAGGIAQALADDLKGHYEQQTQEIIERVMGDAQQQLIEYSSRLRNACIEVQADEDGKVKRKRVYESTVNQVKGMVDLLKNFNLTGNPELEDARIKLESTLDGVTLDDLRESPAARAQVKDGLDDILSKFAPLSLGAFQPEEE
jgi:hypothetical protein